MVNERVGGARGRLAHGAGIPQQQPPASARATGGAQRHGRRRAGRSGGVGRARARRRGDGGGSGAGGGGGGGGGGCAGGRVGDSADSEERMGRRHDARTGSGGASVRAPLGAAAGLRHPRVLLALDRDEERRPRQVRVFAIPERARRVQTGLAEHVRAGCTASEMGTELASGLRGEGGAGGAAAAADGPAALAGDLPPVLLRWVSWCAPWGRWGRGKGERRGGEASERRDGGRSVGKNGFTRRVTRRTTRVCRLPAQIPAEQTGLGVYPPKYPPNKPGRGSKPPTGTRE